MRELTTVVGFEVRGRQTAEMPAAVIVYVFPAEESEKKSLWKTGKALGENLSVKRKLSPNSSFSTG